MEIERVKIDKFIKKDRQKNWTKRLIEKKRRLNSQRLKEKKRFMKKKRREER